MILVVSCLIFERGLFVILIVYPSATVYSFRKRKTWRIFPSYRGQPSGPNFHAFTQNSFKIDLSTYCLWNSRKIFGSSFWLMLIQFMHWCSLYLIHFRWKSNTNRKTRAGFDSRKWSMIDEKIFQINGFVTRWQQGILVFTRVSGVKVFFSSKK